MLAPHLGASSQPWTAAAPLPGGDLEQPGKTVARYDFDAFLRQQARHPGCRPRCALCAQPMVRA
jgi:glycerol-3-phosphate dehydrogenase